MERYKHIKLREKIRIGFSPIPKIVEYPFPKRDRYAHSKKLQDKFLSAWEEDENIKKTAIAISENKGTYIEFKGQKGFKLITKSLENISQKVRLCNVRTENDITIATVFVPNKKKKFFLDRINAYKNTGKKNKKLITSIEDINLAYVESMWTDKQDLPIETLESCEVWLSYNKNEDYERIINDFFEFCVRNEIIYSEEYIVFPERVVVAVRANKMILKEIMLSSDHVTEFRRTATAASFFTKQNDVDEQEAWVEDLIERVVFDKETNVSICLLDKGINNVHPLIKDFLDDKDMSTIFYDDPILFEQNEDPHATLMAGILIYNKLEECLESFEEIKISHKLESVKMFKEKDIDSPELYGFSTAQAIYETESKNPLYKRIITMPVSTDDQYKYKNYMGDGKPTSWSAGIDALCFGSYEGEKSDKRLMILAAGNTRFEELYEDDYRISVINHSVEDPGQSWNALTIGAYTNKAFLSDEEGFEIYKPLVEPGGFSPFNSSSMHWESKWPVKPDIVLEGGNLGYDEENKFYTDMDCLECLTTSRDIRKNSYFTKFSMTSAATAYAANIAARILVENPEMNPETIRALMVHSAEWTDAMKRQVYETENIESLKKNDLRKLFRIVGYGVPDLDKALYTYRNSVNFVIEDEMQPFIKGKTGEPKLNEMNYYKIPWPEEVLITLGNVPVKLKVTLSYFVDPAPGEIGWEDKYRYPGCRLYFDINNIGEDEENFIKRINYNAREEDYNKNANHSNNDKWFFGVNNRNVGSIHSDIWYDTAANLADNRYLAVFPGVGWWKSRAYLKKYNSKIRYSLIMSISTPEQDVDLYTPIMNKINVKTPIKTEIDY